MTIPRTSIISKIQGSERKSELIEILSVAGLGYTAISGLTSGRTIPEITSGVPQVVEPFL